MANTLYRKYRPNSFDGVIGQQHIVATLQNQLKSGRIGHAYLFCGSRGVGKTSLARIFAHALNCQDVNNAPCGKCKTCTDGAGENNLDIIEIDAASNNGVDDARDLREKVKYPPVFGKYKVYIVDEAHMLTGSAFNALLKTLEEPPSHAVFILATTEPHKLPATILSRCMRFDFRLVSMNELFALLCKIYDAEGKKYEDEAVRAIAAAAEGSVRDALSLADTCIALDTGVLTAAGVDKVLGGGSKQTEMLFDTISTGNVAASLEKIDELYISGKSMSVIAKELSVFARDLLVAKTAPKILQATLERQEFLIKTAANHDIQGLAALVKIFSEADGILRYSVSPRIAFECLVMQACKMYSLDIAALDQRILRIERRLDEILLGKVTINTAANNNVASHTAANNTLNNSVLNTAAGNQKDFAADKNNTHNTNNGGISNTDTAILKKNDGDEYPDYGYSDDDIPPQFLSDKDSDTANPVSGAHNSLGVNLKSTGSASSGTANANSANSGGVKLTATQLWGRVITYFRRNSTPALTQVIGRHNPGRLSFNSNTFTVFASREDYLMMCDPALTDTLKEALAVEGVTSKIIIEKDPDDVDLEKEVTALYNEFGKNKVNVLK